MTTPTIRFDDGAAYERYMGRWSQLVGEAFLDWLQPAPALRWLDVGCGNGAFTELLGERCAPQAIHGIDPAAAQLAYARTRPVARLAEFAQGDAMALPFAEGRFDVAVMPLVIFFVPQPAQGVTEMARVVRPGGSVCAYGWDLLGGGFPYELLREALRELGIEAPTPPNPAASQVEVLQGLWANTGLREIETTVIHVQRTYADFDDYWQTVLGGPSVGPTLAALSAADTERLQGWLREQLPLQADGRIVCSARANAIKGVRAA